MKITVNRFLILLSISLFTLVGCDNKSKPPVECDPSIPIPESGIHFDITGVDYSAVSVDESNMTAGARQLAAQCAQCHGTYGVAVADWPDLWGSGREIGKWMQEYQDAEQYIDNVMYLHAIAYTKEEVKLIKEYYEKVSYEGVE